MDTKIEQLLSEALSLVSKFKQGSEAAYIEEAIICDRQALDLCGPGYTKRFTVLNQLASHLWCRYKQYGGIETLHEAIALDREALGFHPLSDADRATFQSDLALHLTDLYSQLGDPNDLELAIVLERDALALRPPGHPDRSTSLSNLALHLSTQCRYYRGGIDQLNEAIALERDALALRPPGHPDRLTSLNNLVSHLHARCVQLGRMDDVDEAIALSRDGLALCPPGRIDRPTCLSNAALALLIRYVQLGEIDTLNEAVVIGRNILALRPQGNPNRSTSLSHLALFLSYRYQHSGVIDELHEAICLERDALVLRPPGHPDRSTSLSNLGLHLSLRYNYFGEIDDLDEAIALGRLGLVLCPPERLDRSFYLSNLACYLSTRYYCLGGADDLDEGVALSRSALDLCPPKNLGRPVCLGNLADGLFNRFKHLEIVDDINEAIALGRDALTLCLPGHPYRLILLNNIALHLYHRYKRSEGISDLNEGVDLLQEALSVPSQPDSVQFLPMNNLANILRTRYVRSGEIVDLDKAIVLARDALALCPSGHELWSAILINLAESLSVQFRQLGVADVREELFSLYARLEHLSHMVSSSDLSAAKKWVSAAEDDHHPTTLAAYETTLRLLAQHLAALPSLPKHLTIFKNLTSSLAADAFSACLRNQSPEKAVELLEQGRGVFWSQLNRLRSPLEDVIASGPGGKRLADDFNHLSTLIRNALALPGAGQHDRVCGLNLELQRVVSRIRELPGLSRFLLAPSFSDLRCAASGGPVVIVNASKYGCDVLIVFADKRPVHIPLSVTKEDVAGLSSRLCSLTKLIGSMDVTRDLGIFLRELWSKIVSPIVNVLQTMCPSHSRIWWCPTAEFSLLPMHAAGPFRDGQKGVLDLYISSYTPTLSALIRARRPGSPNRATEKRHFIGIGQGTATGANKLPSVSSELTHIGRFVHDRAIFTRIDGAEACVSRVADELGQNAWVHFACHGFANRKQPFDSAFALHDGRFTIQHIIRSNLEDAEFAYLSACHTTVGDEDSPDEMIHLASAMQFAGFRSVIGTMWSVADEETEAMTAVFYTHMVDASSGRLDYTRAAFALWKTMRSVDVSFDQRILYVHLGA